MQPVKATRSSLMACATTLQSSIDGLTRIKQVDAHSIFTTMVESLLPEKVKNQWEEMTVDKKTVPPVEELIAFLRKRSAMPQYAVKYTPSSNPSSERKPSKQQFRHKGSVHVASSQPPQPPAQQPEPKPSNQDKGQSYRNKSQSFPPCRYTCPGCNEAHYAYACKQFKEKTLPQRKEYVQANSLCCNCLKPGHSQADCRSRFTRQWCDGKHNTLLHSSEQASSTAPPTSGTVNTTSSHSSTDSFNQHKLMMTCLAVATGPTCLLGHCWIQEQTSLLSPAK